MLFNSGLVTHGINVGSIGPYGPAAERIKVHCFFAKTVPVFVGSVTFLLCRVNTPLVTRIGGVKKIH